MTRTVFTCDYCRTDRATVTDGQHGDDICTACNGVCERVTLCQTCVTRRVTSGCETCLECLCDEIAADPRELDTCTVELQAKVARVLAERLTPIMSRRQAA